MNNIFFKLCLYKTSDRDFELLFGFSIPTHHDVSKWKKMKIKLSPILIFECVMNKGNADYFYNSLDNGYNYELDHKNIQMDFIKDKYRPFDEHARASFKNLSGITEYWNRRKDLIMQLIKDNSHEKNDYEANLMQINKIVKDEFNISFSKYPDLIGNFHEYNIKYLSLFHVETNRKNGISKIIIRKNDQQSYQVQYTVRYNDRNYIDELHLLNENENQFEVESEQPIHSYCLHIYNREGNLVYYKDVAILNKVYVNMALTSRKTIEDSYSKKLKEKASKSQKRLIEEHLNDASYYSNYSFELGPKDDDPIVILHENATNYYAESKYARSDCKYVVNKQVEGEVEGFDVLVNLIDDNDFDEIWIVDPYFDESTALKLLSRIKNSSHYIYLVTAINWKMNNINKFTKAFVCPVEVHFLEKESFHDRYIIRKSKSHMDVYMLSNSINNLAKNYPLVMCELTYEVMLKVCNYLDNLLGENSKKASEPLILPKAKKDEKENAHSQFYNELSKKIKRKEMIDFRGLFDQNFDQSPDDCVALLGEFVVTCKGKKNVLNDVLQSLKLYHQEIISILWSICYKYSYVSEQISVDQILNQYPAIIARYYEADEVYCNALVTLFVLDPKKYLDEYRNNQNSLYVDCILGYYIKFDEELYLYLIQEDDYLISGLMASRLWETSKRVEDPQLFLMEAISKIEDTVTRIQQILIFLMIIQNEGKNAYKFGDIADSLEHKVVEISSDYVVKNELTKCFDVFKLGTQRNTSTILRDMSKIIQDKELKNIIDNVGLKSSKENIFNNMRILKQEDEDIDMYFYFFKNIYPNGNTKEIMTFYDQALFKESTKPYNFDFPNNSWYENKYVLNNTINIFNMYNEIFPNDEEMRSFTYKWSETIHKQEEDDEWINGRILQPKKQIW